MRQNFCTVHSQNRKGVGFNDSHIFVLSDDYLCFGTHSGRQCAGNFSFGKVDSCLVHASSRRAWVKYPDARKESLNKGAVLEVVVP